MAGWVVQEMPGAVLVIPEDDIILHSRDDQCPCGPRVELHGHDCWGHLHLKRMIVHEAMDGRP